MILIKSAASFLFIAVMLSCGMAKISNAQTDSVVIHSCHTYVRGEVDDSSITIDTFDVATGLLRVSVDGDKMVTYTYDQYNNYDTITHYQPLTVPQSRTISNYTSFQKDSIILSQWYISNAWINNMKVVNDYDSLERIYAVTRQRWDTSAWTNYSRTLYVYDSLQQQYSVTEEMWDTSVWQTFVTRYYAYTGNNIDSILIIYAAPDSMLQQYTYDSLGNYIVNNFHWENEAWDTLSDYATYNAQGQLLTSLIGIGENSNTYDSSGVLIHSAGSKHLSSWARSYHYSCSGHLLSTHYWYYNENLGGRTTDCYFYYIGSKELYVALDPPLPICQGDTIQFSDSLILGIQPVTYSWVPSTGLSSDTILNPSAFPDTTTTYYLTATDSMGNTFTDCFTLRVNLVPDASLTALGSTSFCYGDTVHLLATSPNIIPSNYSWYLNGSGLGSGDSILAVTQTGFYHAFLVTQFSCGSASDSIYVFENNAVQTQVTGTSNGNCIGDTAQFWVLPASAYSNYQWFQDSIPIPGATDTSLFVSQIGYYQVNVTSDTSACTFTSNPIFVNFSPPPTPDIIPSNDTTVCQGNGNFVLRTTHNPDWMYRYFKNGVSTWWPINSPDSVFMSISGPTTISIEAFNNGCRASTDSILVDVFPAFSFIITTDLNPPFCHGDTVQLSTSVACNSYEWFNGSVDSVAYADTSVSAYVWVVDTNGCESLAWTNLTFFPPPPIPVILSNGAMIYSVNGTTMQWYLNGTIIPGATVNTYFPSQAGNYTYEVSNPIGCYSISDPYYFSPVSVSAAENFSDIHIQPDVTRDEFEIISQHASKASPVRFEIFSTSGKLVFTNQIVIEKTRIDGTGIKPGMYFWQASFQNDVRLRSGKIIFIE